MHMFIFQFIIFIGFILILAALGFVFRILSVFGGRNPRPFNAGTRDTPDETSNRYADSENEPQRQRRKKKIFDDSVGEYVDFEEVKDKK